MRVVPSGWQARTLADVARWGSGGTPTAGRSDYYGGPIPWAVIGDLTDGLVRTTQKSITAKALAESSATLVPPGAVLIAMYGSIGKLGIAEIEMATNQAIAFALPREDIAPRYLFHYLASQRDQLAGAGKGATQRNISQTILRAWPIPVPPLDEQRRIVDILEDHLSRLDAADATLRAIVAKSRALDRSVMDQLVWGTGAPTRTVEELLREPMRNGFSARASTHGDVRILTLSAVTRRTFSDDCTKLTAADRDRVKGLWLEPGDILVQRSNTPELVGSSALYQGPPNWAVFPDLLIRLRTNTDQVRPEYLCRVLQTERSHRALRAKAKGLAGSMPKVDQAAIGSLPVPFLTADEQDAVLQRAAELDAALGGINEAVDIATRRSRSLRRALLAAAFSGRLTGRASDMDLAEELVTSEAR